MVYTKGGFKSEDTGEFLHRQHKYSKSLHAVSDYKKRWSEMTSGVS